MTVTALIGLQWGDEGKGKVIDALSSGVDVIVRCQGGANAGHTVVVGSANFVESQILAEIYAQALSAKGVTVEKRLNIGSREAYIPALQDGSIDLIPEYSGVLLQYFDKAATAVTSDDVFAALEKATPEGLKVLAQSAAENKDSIAVTKDTAEANNLKSIADLAPVAGSEVLGGPPEFATRPTGIPGLKEKYGLTFKEFVPIDIALRYEVLDKGDADLSILFTTDAQLSESDDYTTLEDDQQVFPAGNVIWVTTPKVVEEAGPDYEKTITQVQEGMDLEVIQELGARVELEKEPAAKVAAEYLEAAGYTG